MRAVVGLGALVLSGLTVGLGGTAGAASSSAGPPSSGEDGRNVGPVTAPVDRDHATVASARGAAMAAHMAGMHHLKVGATATQEYSATASSAVTAASLDPAVFGQWSTLSYKLPLRAVHATLLRTGKFLLVAGSGNVMSDNIIGNFKAYLWDPTTGALTSVPVPYDAFCSSHLVDANGDVIVFGGTFKYAKDGGVWAGSDKVYKFVVATSTWQAMPSMKQGRWYPNTLIDAQNRYLTYSGQDVTGATPTTAERFDPATNTWTPLAARSLPLYPSLHLLKDGRVAYTGAHYGWTHNGAKPATFDPLGTTTVVVGDPGGVIDVKHRDAAMSALVGSADKQLDWVAGGGFPAVSSSYFIDLNATAPTAVAGPSLPAAKAYVSISHLPDLTALETGGGTGTNSPVYEASILNPSTRTLTSMAPPTVPRTYHSSSVTMPDGRVVTFGGDPSGDANFELRVEVFSPPYMFKGTRPTLSTSATQMHYGGSYTLTSTASGAKPASAVIMRPGSATHSMDANQRVLKLTAVAVTGGLKVTLPTNANLAPPGWYLIFVDDSLGRPSVGRWVHLT
jgi:hypothetical protein